MHESSESVSINPRSALANVGHVALLVLGWLVISSQAAGVFALLALGADAFGWAPFLPGEPAERLRWIAALGAVTGLAERVDAHVFRRRT